jgi:uncharacterized protein GlcG (DUF336 family)
MLARASLALACSLFVTAASAQALLAQKTMLTAFAARKLVDACMDIAQKEKFPIAVAVVDPSGNLLSFQATEGATETAILTAQLKAKTAARWSRSTGELKERVDKQINRAPEFIGDFPHTGGFPIFIKKEMVGAIGGGAGGMAADKDDACVTAAVTQVFGADASVERAD